MPIIYKPDKKLIYNLLCLYFAGVCLHVHCGKGRECQVGADGAARCSCATSCAKHRQHLVCGSDGHLYHNHCELHRASCLLRKPLAVDRTMTCLNAGTQLFSQFPPLFYMHICANDEHDRNKLAAKQNTCVFVFYTLARVRLCAANGPF